MKIQTEFGVVEVYADKNCPQDAGPFFYTFDELSFTPPPGYFTGHVVPAPTRSTFRSTVKRVNEHFNKGAPSVKSP